MFFPPSSRPHTRQTERCGRSVKRWRRIYQRQLHTPVYRERTKRHELVVGEFAPGRPEELQLYGEQELRPVRHGNE
jgi:hypothetical protein